jgi:hypothetical protein
MLYIVFLRSLLNKYSNANDIHPSIRPDNHSLRLSNQYSSVYNSSCYHPKSGWWSREKASPDGMQYRMELYSVFYEYLNLFKHKFFQLVF